MLYFKVIFFLAVPGCLVCLGRNASPAESQEKLQGRTHYTAAVVEYQPEGNPWEFTPTELIRKNLDHYQIHISQGSQNNADIIVFPEYGLTTLGIPRDRQAAKPFLLSVPNVGENPCTDQLGSAEIQELSCGAKQSNIYVVVNLGEIRNCFQLHKTEANEFTNFSCHDDGVFQYNTNVAFDRQGTIVAKYEKAHLYFEDQFDKPNPIQMSKFTTDFGVEFGLFTCFDIIFFDPAVRLVEHGIRNFIFPTAWVDELPFLTAIQAHASWAHSSNSNLLASGYHQPLGGQLGSGIYSGKNGPMAYTFDSDSGTKMVISEIPVVPEEFPVGIGITKIEDSKSNIAAYHSFLREDLLNYTSKILDHGKIAEAACTGNGFCCEIEYQLPKYSQSTNSSENYRLLAFNGTRTVAAKTSQYAWQVCGVVRCLNETLESCSENEKSSSEVHLPSFEFLKLKAIFNIRNGTQFLPGLNVFDIQFNLIPHNVFEVETNVKENYVQVSSNSLSAINVKTVAIINKLFDPV